VRRNIFVLGLDDTNRATLGRLADADQYDFHQLLGRDELQTGTVSVPHLLERAHAVLDAFPGSIDAIVGYWDFPVSMMVPILCDRYGLCSASLTAVVKCEHKYWSRLQQQQVIEECPAFGLIDPHDPQPRLPVPLGYPVWIKPIKSTASQGAHFVENDEQLRNALAQVRVEVERIGGPFNAVLELLDLPPDIAGIDGRACIVEEALTGQQVTVEGYSRGGHVDIYGVVDSVSYPDTPSFLRYEYPSSRVPAHVQERMSEISRRVIVALGLTNSTFNIEYFWDPDSDRLRLLEVNARHSQSHARLFEMVDGVSNHAFMIDLGLNREPRRLVPGAGPFPIAAKWFLRRFSDGVVRRVPTAQEISALVARLPGTTVEVLFSVGDRLSNGEGEDSFSFVLAEIVTGGRDQQDLLDRYDKCVRSLPFEIDDIPGGL